MARSTTLRRRAATTALWGSQLLPWRCRRCGGGYTLLDMASASWIMNTLFSTNFCTNNHASPHLFILGMPSTLQIKCWLTLMYGVMQRTPIFMVNGILRSGRNCI